MSSTPHRTSSSGAAATRRARGATPRPRGGAPPPLNSRRPLEIQLCSAVGCDGAYSGVATSHLPDHATSAATTNVATSHSPTAALDFPSSPSALSSAFPSADGTSAFPFASPSASPSAFPSPFPSAFHFAVSIPWPSDAAAQFSAIDGEAAFSCEGRAATNAPDLKSEPAALGAPWKATSVDSQPQQQKRGRRTWGASGGGARGGVEAVSGGHWPAWVVSRREIGRGQYGVIWRCVNRSTGETPCLQEHPKVRQSVVQSAADVETVRSDVAFTEELTGWKHLTQGRAYNEDLPRRRVPLLGIVGAAEYMAPEVFSGASP
ncbi:unnamed protein product [Closterium sp. Naga37s-1]|nr:unnamed protein product [Closterium sp. Naga37s-1]